MRLVIPRSVESSHEQSQAWVLVAQNFSQELGRGGGWGLLSLIIDSS